MLNKIKKALHGILGGQSSHQTDMEYLLSQGLRVGKNLRNHSDYPFDALLPWLITVGDNVIISANVKILAHDTSTEYINGHTKIGVVDIGDNVYIPPFYAMSESVATPLSVREVLSQKTYRPVPFMPEIRPDISAQSRCTKLNMKRN